jgi:hypothetical protein
VQLGVERDSRAFKFELRVHRLRGILKARNCMHDRVPGRKMMEKAEARPTTAD